MGIQNVPFTLPNRNPPPPFPSRERLEALIEAALGLLDDMEGDPDMEGEPDIEANGDEQDHNFTEECFVHHRGSEPGCPISDPGGCEHDGREEQWGENN